MPPTLIFRGKSVPVMDSKGFNITASSSGWIDSDIKRNWFKLFLNYIDKTKTNLLLLDGHSSNLDSDFINLSRENNVIVVVFPANCTHLLQPLDANYFRILKDFIRYELSSKPFTRQWSLCEILVDPYHKSIAPGTIKSSFEIPGIFPTAWKHDIYFKKSNQEVFDSILNPLPSNKDNYSHSEPLQISNSPTIKVSQLISTELQVLPEKQFNFVSLPTPFNTNALTPSVNLSNPSYSFSQTEIIQTEITSELMEKLDKIIEMNDEILKSQKKRKQSDSFISTKKGAILTSNELQQKFQAKKMKKLENESKELEKQMQRNQEQRALLLNQQMTQSNSGTSIASPSLALPSPPLILPSPPLVLPQFSKDQIIAYRYPQHLTTVKIGKIIQIKEDNILEVLESQMRTKKNGELKFIFNTSNDPISISTQAVISSKIKLKVDGTITKKSYPSFQILLQTNNFTLA